MLHLLLFHVFLFLHLYIFAFNTKPPPLRKQSYADLQKGVADVSHVLAWKDILAV
jgi:hypothetical protein